MAKHAHGLGHDLRTLAHQQNRRDILRWIGGGAVLGMFIGCDSESELGADAGTGAGSGATGCTVIPEETGGPYPGDGTNGPNVLAQTGVVRSDIRSSFGASSGVAAGVPLTVRLKLVNVSGSCASLAGYSIYIWHCDAVGRYSMYSSGVTGENYLRGVQTTDASGEVTFTTVFPGCYSGRWPHIHFEIYPNVPTSTSGKLKTSQLALPETVCREIYATNGYSASTTNLNGVSLTSDNVFRDGVTDQLATVTGDTTSGYTAVLAVGINA